jgi:hypothetical protein
MRDPRRIDRVIELLRSYWHANPDLRLGQIIINFTPPRFRDICEHGGSVDPYHVEDSEWEQLFRSALKQIAKESK